METVIFCGRKNNSDEDKHIDYYMIEEEIGRCRTGMHSYGIRIAATQLFPGGGKTIDMKQLNNVFYRRRDAEQFIHSLISAAALPNELYGYVEDYITHSIAV